VAAERVVQADEVARIARNRGAHAVAHGSTGAGNDQVRFDGAFQVLAPGLEILAPIRDLGLTRAQEYEYLRKEGVEIDPSVKDYSVNAGLWGATIGGRETHDPWSEIPDTVWPYPVPGTIAPRDVVLTFEKGLPVAIDGTRGSGSEIIAGLGGIANSFGVGRGIHLGDTVMGIKGRVAFQAGAALILIAAHRELEKLVLTSWQRFWKDHLADFWGKLLHEAQAFDPVMQDIRALIDSSQKRVSGDVRVKLTAGRFEVTGVQSPHSMMRREAGLYGEEARLWQSQDAAGFGRILGIPGRLYRQAADDEPGA
jgi:argininosuccinate synthase